MYEVQSEYIHVNTHHSYATYDFLHILAQAPRATNENGYTGELVHLPTLVRFKKVTATLNLRSQRTNESPFNGELTQPVCVFQ